MKGPCEHCGNPMKEFWTTQCMYKGDFPSRRAFIRSTFDPPCACDSYDEDQRELARSSNRIVALYLTLFAVVIGGVWYFTH